MYKAFACDAVVIDDGDEGLLRYCVSEVSEVGRNVAFDDGEIARVVIENFRVIGERGFHVGDVVLVAMCLTTWASMSPSSLSVVFLVMLLR